MSILFACIMGFCALITLPLLYTDRMDAAKWRKGILLGVTLPREALSDPTARAVTERYRRDLRRGTVLLLLLLLPSFFLPYFSFVLIYDALWFLLLFFTYPIPLGRAYKRLMAYKETLSASDTQTPTDEDRFWLWGQFYYNPDNKRTLIPARVGTNTSVNLAKVGGKLFYLVAVVSLLFMVFLGIWVADAEFTRVSVTLTEDAVIAEHTKREFTVPYDTVKAAVLYTRHTVPRRSKRVGTAMAHVQTGSFEVRGHGRAKLCLDPGESHFLLLETEEGQYMVSLSEEEAQTVSLILGERLTAPK